MCCISFPKRPAKHRRSISIWESGVVAKRWKGGNNASQAARFMCVSQPRISGLVRGKIGLFTIDALVNMLSAAGLTIDLEINRGKPKAKNRRVA